MRAHYDFTESGEYGGFVAVSVVDKNGGPVSCKVYVNGQVVSKSNDNSDYYEASRPATDRSQHPRCWWGR